MPVSNPIRFVDLLDTDVASTSDIEELQTQIDAHNQALISVNAALQSLDNHDHDYAAANHSHSYAATNHNHTISRFESQPGRHRLKVRGNANSNSEYNVLDTDGRCKYLHWSGGTRFALMVDSTWLFINPDPSDRRFKKNIVNEDSEARWESALEGLSNIPLVSYDWDTENYPIFSGSRTNLGVIAQDLQVINPDLVDIDPDGYLHVNLSNCVIQLVAAIKGLNQKVETLESRLAEAEI